MTFHAVGVVRDLATLLHLPDEPRALFAQFGRDHGERSRAFYRRVHRRPLRRSCRFLWRRASISFGQSQYHSLPPSGSTKTFVATLWHLRQMAITGWRLDCDASSMY